MNQLIKSFIRWSITDYAAVGISLLFQHVALKICTQRYARSGRKMVYGVGYEWLRTEQTEQAELLKQYMCAILAKGVGSHSA